MVPDYSHTYQISVLIKQEFDFFGEMDKQGFRFGKSPKKLPSESNQEAQVNCTAWISDISNNGRVSIAFSHEIDGNYSITELNESIIDITVIPSNDTVEMANYDKSHMELTWEPIKLDSKELSIQLKFRNATLVSGEMIPDMLYVAFIDYKVD